MAYESPTQNEQDILSELREQLLTRNPDIEHRGNRIEVEDVRVGTHGSCRSIFILFREETRPECLFGYRFLADEFMDSSIIVTNFEEEIEAIGYGLPPDCDPGGITWID